MFREQISKLTGGQITAITLAAILVPGAVGAAVTFTAVGIVDPISGTQARVVGGSLFTRNIYAQYRENPANYVSIEIPMVVADGCNPAYTIPAGKALVITAMNGNFYNSRGLSYTGVAIFSGATCSGKLYVKDFVPANPGGPVNAKSFSYGQGIAIPAGSLSVYGFNDAGNTFLQGFLVPANLVPVPAGPVSAAPRTLGPAAPQQ